MSYLEEFKNQINNRDIQKFFILWEEYCTNDVVDVDEFLEFLHLVKNSELARNFGALAESALPLWEAVPDTEARYKILRLIIDLETTNSPNLADVTLKALKERYPNDPDFNERIRLIGLRSRENFQGALSNYDLLAHMAKGKFVHHAGGWGTGEITAISPLREQISIEFENVSGQKHINFSNAFKTVTPLSDESFLARRFSDADALEKEARENPLAIVKMLLNDLGPKNATEIKDEMCELVIPEKEWSKWWQSARTKIKKDPLIENPENLRDAFRLRKVGISNEELLQKATKNKTGVEEIILSTYNFMRDLPNATKQKEVTKPLLDKVLGILQNPGLTKAQEIQVHILLKTLFEYEVEANKAENLIKNMSNLDETINRIDILALKKRALMMIREQRSDWVPLFLSLLFSVQQGALRDYLIKELNQNETKPLFINKIKTLINNPLMHPEFMVWYFNKVIANEDRLPFSDKEGLCTALEAFLILYSHIENKAEYKELVKKMYLTLSGKRYAVIRQIIENSSVDYIKEFLLLVTKCQTFSDHDVKIMHSLAEVVHPSIANAKEKKSHKQLDGHTIWTTEVGYLKTQEKLKHIATKEMIENAREVEAARALGDLRENSEYKFACERRHRLQGEMKTLSQDLSHARVITKDDIFPDEVSVGNVVSIKDPQGKVNVYTILGPWDADVDSNILSFQSKLAQAMLGFKDGDTFPFKDEDYTITSIRSYLDK